MFTAAMLEEPNNKPYLHKNKIYFPKENHSIDLLLQHGLREHTLYPIFKTETILTKAWLCTGVCKESPK